MTDIHSLQSRMKHRKVLGVGENSDGIPRSKISQLLGNQPATEFLVNDEEYPVLLRPFLWFMCLYFAISGLNITFRSDEVDSTMDLALLSNDDIYHEKDIKENSFMDIFSNLEHLLSHVQSDPQTMRELTRALQLMEKIMASLKLQSIFHGICLLSLSSIIFTTTVAYSNHRSAVRVVLTMTGYYFLLRILGFAFIFYFHDLHDPHDMLPSVLVCLLGVAGSFVLLRKTRGNIPTRLEQRDSNGSNGM